jgi:hypothetical protein
MFIGHFAVALAAKKTAPKVSLGTLFMSAQLVDLLWPLFLLLGFEHVRIDPGNTVVTPLDFYDYPITHSLVAAIIWSLFLGLFYYVFKHDRKSSLVIGFCVFSHWVLDFLTHRPDLPLAFGHETYFGLGLWNSLAGTMVVEIALFVGGILLYLRATSAKNKIGVYGFWILILFLFLIYLGNVFGPPTPDEFTIAVAGNASWLFVIWAYWIDNHRTVIAAL